MTTEDYVSFETAKLLKEKGFWENCPFSLSKLDEKTNDVETVRCPTLQMAMKWLREVHKIGIFPSTYTHIIESHPTHTYGTAIINLNTYELMTDDYMARDTYEEAAEAAIKYCLKNL